MNHRLSERERAILTLIAEQENVSVSNMSRLLNVSPVTVRSDLNNLADKGYIVRTWGGAFPAFVPEVLERQRSMTEEKNRIAKAAAEFVEDGDTVMIEAGTTTALIAKYLFGKRDISIVTNSTLVLPYARANPSIHLTVVGGQFRPASESFVGPIALRELEQFHVKLAFVGTDGFDFATGLTTHLVEGAEIVKKMAAQAERTVLTADSTKHGRAGFVRVLSLDALDTILTDSRIDREFLTRCAERGLDIRTV